VAKNLIQLLTRQRTVGAGESPLVLEEEKAEEILLDDGQALPATPLQSLANAIHKASADLHAMDEIRLRLESLKAPIQVEFENRVVDNNRLAQLTSELRSTR
jgi:hypothetical protein